MSDPILGSQLNRQNPGVSGFSKLAGPKPQAENPSAGKPTLASSPSAEGGAKQRLTTFLNKLETTWQLFQRGTRESDDGALPKGKAAYLEDADVPNPDTLKAFRTQAKQGIGGYKASQAPRSSLSAGPKEAPLTERATETRGGSGLRSSTPGAATAPPRANAGPGSAPTTGGSASSPAWQPTGSPSSRAFLATTQTPGAQLRASDASGRPAQPFQSELLARQPVFSQSLAQVHRQVTSRQVSSQMPIHNAFLDERHESESEPASPLRLFWDGSSSKARPTKSPLAEQPRLRLAPQGEGGRALAAPLSLHSAALSSARADLANRFAGKAIHSLLQKLYDEEDLEELDEEEAVNGLGLILRLGGEFTYEHSTRVLDLALELADEVGVRDKTTRREIRYGAVLCDIGEWDMLLQSGPDSERQVQGLTEFLGGQDMLRAGLLHDIGKVKIPPEILYKPGRLTPEEYEIMKMHPIWGEDIVRPIASLRYLCPTIRGHHERWDGLGYPDGLRGEDIPVAARIISVADVFDALSAERPYKRGLELERVKEILLEGRGTHFDPSLVDAFLQIVDRRHAEEDELSWEDTV